MIFIWDVRKAAANLKKHGTDFHEAATVFDDSLSTTFPDTDHSENEQRFLTIGQSVHRRVLVIAHTEEGDTIRIISARKATRRELNFYEEIQPE
ncbi:MAG TPA: BrnT family toxin [Candidatus Angelobacter sp.]|nr:BrnT family toxin [Candidatus Angelobacter sp.]